jgi:hypothetical protein
MSWRSALRAVIRLGVISAVALSGMSFSADDAEARRGGKVRSSHERKPQERSTSDDHSTKRKSDEQHDDHATKRKSDEQHDAQGADDAGGTSVPRVRSRGAARTSDDTATDAGGLPSPQRSTPRPRAAQAMPVQDIEVSGCPTGMICTVCLAGCSGDIGGIVNAQNKTPVPDFRE